MKYVLNYTVTDLSYFMLRYYVTVVCTVVATQVSSNKWKVDIISDKMHPCSSLKFWISIF